MTYSEIQNICIEGRCYGRAEIERMLADLPAASSDFRRELFSFLSEWFSSDSRMRVHTSGSTGRPKELWVEKNRMIESARLTCSFLGLQPGDSALLCMPLPYIAGKMVVVRALVASLDLWPITPSGHPLQGLKVAPVFAAMTPMQVYNSLQIREERELLQGIRHLIIGGGAISPQLAEELRSFPRAVWSTYGMTETLSHIALRRLSGPEATNWYTPMEGVRIRLSEEKTLIIHAQRVCPDELQTNDIAEINELGQFLILGRKDNTIVSGGVKIQIEQVEAALKEHLPQPFLITSAPDEKFGEAVVLLVEGSPAADWEQICRQALPAYWRPKRVLSVAHLPLTGTGKPDRAEARRLAQE